MYVKSTALWLHVNQCGKSIVAEAKQIPTWVFANLCCRLGIWQVCKCPVLAIIVTVSISPGRLLWFVNYNVFIVTIWNAKFRIGCQMLQVITVLELYNKLSAIFLCNPKKRPEPINILEVKISKDWSARMRLDKPTCSLIDEGLALFCWRIGNPGAFANKSNRS